MPVEAEIFHPALGFGLASAIGFLIGRTREEIMAATAPATKQKPGIRDFMILALSGALASFLGNTPLTIGLLITSAAMLFLVRWQQPERKGITTELGGIATFALGYTCLTEHRSIAAGLGIALAAILNTKEQMHAFALKIISQREFSDTLKFLALIFVIYPLLPVGSFGPWEFFEPRKIWFFVILVSSVSYFGYFLTKFVDPKRGMMLSAVVGGIASTTAYTGGMARAVAEAPGSAAPLARATLLANAVQYPRLFVILLVLAPSLAMQSVPFLTAMMLAGLVSAFLLTTSANKPSPDSGLTGFKNPFSFYPALKYGLIFMAVLASVRYVQTAYGSEAQLVASFLGGLIDVDAVSLTQADAFMKGTIATRHALWSIYIATAGNALFKFTLAAFSRNIGFAIRVGAGFLLMLLAGAAVLFLS